MVQQKITQPLGDKNVLKIQILVTIKLQEIGTGHLGLVVAKLKNSNCDTTQKNKLLQNLKDQTVTKLKNSICAKLKKIKS